MARAIASSSAATGRESRNLARRRSRHPRNERMRHLLAFGMDGDRQVQARGLAHAFRQRRVVGVGKLRKPRVAHERLEAHHSALGHCRHLTDRPWNQSAPEPEVGDRRGFQRLALAIDLIGAHGARYRVQGHVEEERASTCSERATSGAGALPLCMSRLVEVQMHVDDAGKNVKPARVNLADRHRLVLARSRQYGRRKSARPPSHGGRDRQVCRREQSNQSWSPIASLSRNFKPASRAAATSSSRTFSAG